MLFAGVPEGSETEKKIDRCVRKVMAENPSWSKSRAIATCRKAIEKKSEGVMPKTKKGQTARQRRKEDRKELAKKPEALELAENPMADIEAEDEYYSLEDFVKDNPEDDDLGTDDVGSEEKCMDTVGVVDFTPPTDFEELDAEREAAEKAAKLRQVGWDADRLLTNIVHNSVLEPEEKEEKIAKVGSDLAKRLAKAVQDNKETDEKDLDLIEAEMWASFAGENFVEKFKAKLTTTARNKLPDSAFACIIDDERHLPIHDKAHVRNALARLPQMMKRGGKSAEVAKCGRSKVMAAAKKMGIGKAGKDNINGIIVEKDADNTYRWIGWVSNNFKDRDGEIISEEAHKEFVDYLDRNPTHAPEFWTWHTRGTARTSKVDAWLYHEGFLIMSGPLTDIEAYRLMKTISSDDIGMSHGFFALKDGNVITKYRAYEVSELPLKRAANVWTSIETKLKEVSSMNERLEFLRGAVGEEFVDNLLETAEDNKDFLVELGIESKDVEEPEASEEEASKELTKKQKKTLSEYFGEDFEQIKKDLEYSRELLPVMAKEILELKGKLEESEKDKSDKLADMIESPVSKRAKTLNLRPSEDEKNVAKDDEEIEGPSISGKGTEDDWFGTYIEREEE